jgi:cell division septation protein DedD
MATDEEAPPQLRIPAYAREEPEPEIAPQPEPRSRPAPPRDISSVDSARQRGRELGIAIFLAAALGLVVLFVLVRDGQMSDQLQRMQNSLTRLAANEPAEPSDTQLRLVERRLRDLEVAMVSQPQANATGVSPAERLSKLEDQVQQLRGMLEQIRSQAAAKPEPQAPKAEQTAQPTPAVAAAKPAEKGGWVVQLSAVGDQKDAQALADKAREHGYQVAIEQTKAKGQTYYRVAATGFDSHAQATAAAKRLRKDLGLSQDPWVAVRK